MSKHFLFGVAVWLIRENGAISAPFKFRMQHTQLLSKMHHAQLQVLHIGQNLGCLYAEWFWSSSCSLRQAVPITIYPILFGKLDRMAEFTLICDIMYAMHNASSNRSLCVVFILECRLYRRLVCSDIARGLGSLGRGRPQWGVKKS